MVSFNRLFLLIFLLPAIAGAQTTNFFVLKKDSSGFLLTQAGASHLASLPLRCILQEYPNKTGHTSLSDSDHVIVPSKLHPAFFGCFDWHSSVHGHWMLVRLLKQFPQLPEASRIRETLNRTLSEENIRAEVAYFRLPLTASWERTYGWAWLLKLDEELSTWNDADGRNWHRALQPLTSTLVQQWMQFLPKATYPNRTGVHPNTAFGLVFALDYARAVKNRSFEDAIINWSKKIYGTDKNAPAVWEPNGSDFLSPSLETADLMRRILSPVQFRNWFHTYLPVTAVTHLSRLPVVSDRSDLQIVHLDGLSFSRSWCMSGIANVLLPTDPRKKLLQRSAINHLSHALPHVVSGEYGGEHWLASFAVYALLGQN